MTDNEPRYATSDGAPAIAYGAAGEDDTSLGGDDGSAFLADLARAMQVTAGAQRARVAEAAEERRQAYIDAIRGREAAQTEELREVAERDVKGIEAWATAEIERIRLERQRRISARKTELERRLEQHHTLIERQIAAVEVAVVAYRDEVDRFFGRLDVESDPIAIARQAGNLPPFPVLESIGPDDEPYVAFDASVASPVEPVQAQPVDGNDEPRAGDDGTGEPGEPVEAGGPAAAADEPVAAADDLVAAAEAVSASAGDTPMIVVMHDEAPVPVPVAVAPWDRRPDQSVDQAGDRAGGEGAPGEDAESESEPLIGAGVTKITPRSSGAIIQSVPSLRPIGSWLRRSNNSD